MDIHYVHTISDIRQRIRREERNKAIMQWAVPGLCLAAIGVLVALVLL